MATLLPVVQVIGTVIGFMGSMQQAAGQEAAAKAQANAARYNAAVATNNAAIAKQNAAWMAQEGQARTLAQQMKTRAEVSALTASEASSGVRLDSASFTDVRSTAREQGELSALDIRTKTARQAYGYDVEATNYMAQAGLDKMNAASSLAAGKIASSATLMGGLGDAAGGFSNYMSSRSLDSGAETWSNGDPFRTY